MRTRYVALGLAVALVVAGVGAWVVVQRRGEGGSPVERAVKSVHDAHPLLLPTKIPGSWKAQTKVSRSFFDVRWTAPDAGSWVELQIAIPNPPPPGTSTVQRTMKFRGDDKALFQGDDGVRLLLWWEPGQWNPHVAGTRTDAVPYYLTSHGVDETQFLAIAGSLRGLS